MIFNYLNTYFLYPLAENQLNRNIRSKIKDLLADDNLSAEARTERTKKQLHAILSTAGNKVPYYRELFDNIGFYPDLILKDLNHLQALPYLTKEIVQEQGARLLNSDLKKETLHVRKTGGSTGISTLIYYDQSSLDWTAAVNLHAQSFTGRRPVDTEVHFSTNFFESPALRDQLREKIKCLAMNRTNILTHSFTQEALAQAWAQIKKAQPFLVQGHPSTLYALAKHIESTNVPQSNFIKVFESTGESVDQKKIEVIEKYLGCKVYNRYGTAEFGVTAHSRDNAHELEIIDSVVYHETVALGNGLEEIVGTTTTNFAMPLIRYRSGDIGLIEDRGNKKVITQLQGRVHDLVDIKGTPYPTHYLQDVFDRIGGVAEFQIVIEKNQQRFLNVVLDNNEKKDAILAKIESLFGSDIIVKFVGLNDLLRVGWRDKFRYVVKEP